MRMVRCVVSMLLKQDSMGSGTSYWYFSVGSSPFSSPTADMMAVGVWGLPTRAGLPELCCFGADGPALPAAGLYSSGVAPSVPVLRRRFGSMRIPKPAITTTDAWPTPVRPSYGFTDE